MSRRKKTFSKKAVRWLLIIALFDLQLSYLLAFLGREQIAETLSITVVTEIIAVMLGYFMKSFKETKEEENVRLLEEQREIDERQEFVEDLRRGIENENQ
ncbi:hypothetical protein [Anaerotignum sp.]|uniref:hypothetical protein n=1 Tax=Anaerotignum sp. TaxID=2039241 RepID=UPI0028A8997C|nr:hypothetical protein [Anaerotignum sp.]